MQITLALEGQRWRFQVPGNSLVVSLRINCFRRLAQRWIKIVLLLQLHGHAVWDFVQKTRRQLWFYWTAELQR